MIESILLPDNNPTSKVENNQSEEIKLTDLEELKTSLKASDLTDEEKEILKPFL